MVPIEAGELFQKKVYEVKSVGQGYITAKESFRHGHQWDAFKKIIESKNSKVNAFSFAEHRDFRWRLYST